MRSPNQRSTWLSHEELVGVRCMWNWGRVSGHVLIAGVKGVRHSGMPELIGSTGEDRSSDWIPDFSSTLSISAGSSGSR